MAEHTSSRAAADWPRKDAVPPGPSAPPPPPLPSPGPQDVSSATPASSPEAPASAPRSSRSLGSKQPTPSRRSPAHAAPRSSKRRRKVVDVLLTGVGELLITAGLVIGLFLVWQLWWTGIEANEKAEAATKTFVTTQEDSPKVSGTKHYEDPPPFAQVGYGETIGMLVVPKWYGLTNNNMPIQEGIGSDVLDQAAAGHYPDTQQVGEVGNFAVAGHRRSNGNSFRRVDLLEPGDEIIVSTKDTWYVYTVESYEIVLPSQTEVIAPVPGQPEVAATDRYLTMTTCHSETVGEWGNDHRWIVHAKFSYWMPRSEGRPESVLQDPEVN